MKNLDQSKIYDVVEKDGEVMGAKGKINLYLKSKNDQIPKTISIYILIDGTWKLAINYGANKPLSLPGKSASFEEAKMEAILFCKEIASTYKKNYLQYALRNDQKANDYSESFCYSTGGLIEIN